jgi:hypothetical protein
VGRGRSGRGKRGQAATEARQSGGEAVEAAATPASAAAPADLEIGWEAGQRVVGPFELRIEDGQASLWFAREKVAGGLPNDPKEILAQARRLRDSLLAAPKDLAGLDSEVRQAIGAAGAGGRVNLPDLYRSLAARRGGTKNYSRARFAVEIKALVTSDRNLGATHRLKIEPAVIEDAKTKKSLFIPNRNSRGNGEGTYYRAVVVL